jgi:drug/metabolite transporter (DMT)-like permease
MDTIVFAMVIAAAVMHAVWNAIVKTQNDRLVMMAMISGWGGFCSLLVLPFLPLPSAEVWPYIGISIVLKNAYYLFLISAYRHGDLSHVYPIARGSAPLIVTLISVWILGETLSQGGLLAVTMIGVGVLSLAATRGQESFVDLKPAAFALATGLFIALYTVVDGLGARIAGNPHSFIFWQFFVDGFPLALFVLAVRGRKALNAVRGNWAVGLFGGVVSLIAIWLVIWAMTLAPIAYVSALRETSIVFAVLIGAVFLKERLDLRRLTAIFLTMAGSLILKSSR